MDKSLKRLPSKLLFIFISDIQLCINLHDFRYCILSFNSLISVGAMHKSYVTFMSSGIIDYQFKTYKIIKYYEKK